LALAIEAQGSITSAKMPLKPTPLMMPLKKTKSKILQFLKIQSRRLATSFEGLNSSLA